MNVLCVRFKAKSLEYLIAFKKSILFMTCLHLILSNAVLSKSSGRSFELLWLKYH